MQTGTDENKTVLPHHEQLPLCTTRLPYRQGRKLTAVKVYNIVTETNHLLIFGVPALNLRQETKALFMKFGKLIQFNISPQHPCESFTETFHAQYERIQSARIAKRMLDTKNFYGGSLHVCYAPEMETIEETRQKLLQRQNNVTYRLRNLQLCETKTKDPIAIAVRKEVEVKKLNMGEINTISIGKEIRVNKSKRKKDPVVSPKRFKPLFLNDVANVANCNKNCGNTDNINGDITKENRLGYNENTEKTKDVSTKNEILIEKGPIYNSVDNIAIEVVDCTSVENEVITNINEHLNYDRFGNEDVRNVPKKPVNRIVFNVNKKS